jgi:hypothetical protein
MRLVKLVPARDGVHKYIAYFETDEGKEKKVRFGAKGYTDFTKSKGKDEARKQRYIDRHRERENWNDPMTAGALSRYILWNKPTIAASVADYKRRFNL